MTASWSDGKKVLGGGSRFYPDHLLAGDTGVEGETLLTDDMPTAGGDGWTVCVEHRGSELKGAALSAYAICADVQE
jgi:hypothetical protein